MVNRTSFLLTVLFVTFFSITAFAASFTASVDRANISAGESLTLQLKLSGANPSAAPDVTGLEQDFKIHSSGQSSQTSIVNGKTNSSINWHVVLLPRREGMLNIPALSIDTDAGKLTSEAIAVNVAKPSASAQSGQNSTFFVDTELSKKNPYRNEPVLLTAKLIARRALNGVKMSDFVVDNAIAEPLGEPQVYEGVLRGERVQVVEVRYMITPLKDGALKIPGFMFEGNINTGRRQDPFGGGVDPFAMFGNLGDFMGFAAFEPFAVAGQESSIEVRPPAAAMDQWLPAYMLQISDKWENADEAKVGEPITRKLTIIAEGMSGAALPSLEDKIDPADHFKIYADKPATGDNPSKDGKSIGGWREESYTLIPQKAGTITLPEMDIAWWDLLDNKIVHATVPAKTIAVKPGAPQAEPPTTQERAAPQDKKEPVSAKEPAQTAAQQTAPAWLYGVIAALGIAVLALAGMVVYLLRKKPQARFAAPPAANEDRVSLTELKKAQSAEDLCAFLQLYAHHHWGMPNNTALKTIAAGLAGRYPGEELKKLAALFDNVDAALYGGKAIDVEAVKKSCAALLGGAGRKSLKEKQPQKKGSGRLNPS